MPRRPQAASLLTRIILSLEMTHGKHPRSACAGVSACAPGSRSSQILRRATPPAEPMRTIKGVVPCEDPQTFWAAKTVDPSPVAVGLYRHLRISPRRPYRLHCLQPEPRRQLCRGFRPGIGQSM